MRRIRNSVGDDSLSDTFTVEAQLEALVQQLRDVTISFADRGDVIDRLVVGFEVDRRLDVSDRTVFAFACYCDVDLPDGDMPAHWPRRPEGFEDEQLIDGRFITSTAEMMLLHTMNTDSIRWAVSHRSRTARQQLVFHSLYKPQLFSIESRILSA